MKFPLVKSRFSSTLKPPPATVLALTISLLLTTAACGGSKTAVAKPTNTPKPLPTPTTRPLNAVLSGSVAKISRSGNGTRLSVRVTHDGLKQLPITPSTPVVTSDGHVLTPSSIRAGDSVALAKAGSLYDLSQQQSSLKGIVQTALEIPSGFLIVELASGKDIVVEVGSTTAIRTTTNKPLEAGLVAIADPVVLTGILDSRLSEMTETQQVVVTQPVRKPGKGS